MAKNRIFSIFARIAPILRRTVYLFRTVFQLKFSTLTSKCQNFPSISWLFGITFSSFFLCLWWSNLSPILKWFRYPTYLTVESDAKHAIWVRNGIKTKMHFKSLVVLFRQINFWWTLLFGKQRGCIPGLYYQRGRKAHALKPMCKNACTRIQFTLVQGITWDW